MNENENRFKSRDESVKGRVGWISDASEVLNIIIKLSFVFGSLLLFYYFISIRYVPFMALGISGIGWIVFLIFILGLVLVVVMGLSFFGPGLLLGLYYINTIESNGENIENHNKSKQEEKNKTSFFDFNPYIFLCLYYIILIIIVVAIITYHFCRHSCIGVLAILITIIATILWSKPRGLKLIKLFKKCFLFLIFEWFLFLIFVLSPLLTFIFLVSLINTPSSHVLDIIALLVLLILSNFAIVKVSVDLKKSNISVNPAFAEKEFFKKSGFLIFVTLIMILLFIHKFYVVSYFPMKQLRLGQVNIELKLNNCAEKCYLKSLKDEFCFNYNNSKKDDFCSSLSEHSVLKGFLLFRTPSEYIVRIDNKGKRDIMVVKSKFVEFPIFPDNSKRTKYSNNV